VAHHGTTLAGIGAIVPRHADRQPGGVDIGHPPVKTHPAHDAGQDVRFCRAPDGARIAYAVHGRGPALVINSCWLSHLQYDWQSPVWRHFGPGVTGASRRRAWLPDGATKWPT
jgi:hypothetical protein